MDMHFVGYSSKTEDKNGNLVKILGRGQPSGWSIGFRNGMSGFDAHYLQNTLRGHTEYVLVKPVGSKVLWVESRVLGTGEYFPPLQFNAKIVEFEIGGVAIYCPFEEFRQANSYCHLYGAQGEGRRQDFF
ncbi:uncharacterized protein TNCV_3879001 [Trichonephila clavipes]|nr:uncharacterized protein TNCV_3879001 [Trichonephila clavipes]